MTNLDTPSSIIKVMAGPSTTSSEMSDETLRVMMQRQDVLAANQQEILLQLNQMGGARQDLGTPIELDVARTLEELAVLEAKLKEHLDYKKTMMGAIMRSLSGLEDMAVEDLTTSVLKHAPARSKLQVQSVPEVSVPEVVISNQSLSQSG
ncbi:hypothetical protein UPYG_G00260300 [Umbra pygmaea]|uniref:Uncharacterized protein n=1 Tax=Umbra pygmaea TaxID=75934 RepID=A0ABD0WDW8_UMBPY